MNSPDSRFAEKTLAILKQLRRERRGHDLPEPGEQITVTLRGGDLVEGTVTSLVLDDGQDVVLYSSASGERWAYPEQIVRAVLK